MTQRSSSRLLVLLDRDGTLVYEADYPKDPRKVRLLPGVPQALRRLRKSGCRVIVVTNQSGVGRGLITWRQLHSVNRRFFQILKREKAPIDGLYWCPHHPKDRCACRKPALGLVRRAAKHLRISWKKSISVGDRASDILLGQRTGGQGILVLTGYGRIQRKRLGPVVPDYVAPTFRQATEWILRHKKGIQHVR